MKAVVTVIAAIAAGGNFYAAERYEFEEPHMGTKVRLVFYAASNEAAAKASRAAFYRIREIENVLSDYKADSEIMRLCRANDTAAGTAFTISDDLVKVLTVAQEVSAKSDGAFDVTIGPLSKLWRVTRKHNSLPDAKTLEQAKSKVGWRQLTLDAKAKTVSIAISGVRIDFGGIGKGYAADEVLKLLTSMGITSALVAMSGDIAVSDAPPGKDGWIVEIAPLDPKAPPRRLLLKHKAVSTSGDLFQHVEINGVRYSHVLDPKTGLGLTGFRSATVIANDGTHADALSKVASIMPAAEALKVIEGFKRSAFIAIKDQQPIESKDFGSYLLK